MARTACLNADGATINVRALFDCERRRTVGRRTAEGLARQHAHAPQKKRGKKKRAAREGQPHRDEAPLRARPRLHLPESRQADHLRDSVRARLHADRHDRHRVSAAMRRRWKSAPTKSAICAIRSTATSSSTSRRRTSAGPIRACGRFWRTRRPRTPSAVTRDYLLELDAPEKRSAFAVGVRRQDHDLSQACGRSRRQARRSARLGRRTWTEGAPLPGGDIADANFERFLAPLRPAVPVAVRAVAHRCARAYGSARRAGRRRGSGRSRISARSSPRGCMRPNCAVCATTNGRCAPKTSCGAARSSVCTSIPRRSPT